jgi:hypothetical protein
MWWISRMTIYLVILCFASFAGLVHYKKMDKPTRIMVWYVVITLISESIATYAAFVFKNNLPVYHFYNLIQFLLLSLYFNYSAEKQHFKLSGWIIGLTGIIFSIVNSVYFQHPTKELNTNFVIIESFLIIGMSLFSFYRLLVSDFIYIHLSPKFWFSAILLVFWSFTFFYWLVGVIIYKSMPNMSFWLDAMIWFINIVAYSAIAAVFLFYNKMKPT